MSQSDLRDLLHDRVADESTIDLSSRAWRAGRAVRRRRRLAVAGGVSAGALAVTGVVAWARSEAPVDRLLAEPTPSVATTATTSPSTPTPSITSDPGPDATYDGANVWFSPDQAEERDLPYVEDGPLPSTIDLGVRSKALTGPAVAAFGSGDVVLLVDAVGGVVSVDVSRLDDVLEPDGDLLPPQHDHMLSPGGRWLMFPQGNEVAVYDIAAGSWSTIDAQGRQTYGAGWADDGTIAIAPGVGPALKVFQNPGPDLVQQALATWSPSFDTGSAQPYGPTRTDGSSLAQAWGTGVEVPVRDPSTSRPEPELVAFDTGRPATSGVLSVTWTATGDDSRAEQCCSVAGWTSPTTLVYLSDQASRRLVSWDIATDTFGTLATIKGDYTAVSFADLA